MVRYGYLSSTVQGVVILLILAGLTLPPQIYSQETVAISLGDDVRIETIDIDDNLRYEYLIVKIDITIYRPGSYGVHGDIGQGITANSGPFDLGIGSHTIELEFSGGQISRAAATGNIIVDVEAFSRDPNTPSVTRTYITGMAMEPSAFEPPSDSIYTEVSIIGSEVVLSGPIMEVRINKTSPTLSFSYSGDAGSQTRSSVTYIEMIAYDDLDRNGRWDEGVDEPKYTSDLNDVDWELGTDFSSGYDITLYGVIQLKLAGTSTFVAWAKITFRISSEFMNLDEPSQKFNIDIDLWQPLDAERLAIKQVLSDDTGRFDLVEGETIGREDHSITVMKNDDRAYGTYSWTNDILIGKDELSIESRAKSWYSIDGSDASIWFCYPLGDDVQLIHHDPTMRMDPNVPEVSVESDFLINRPVLMLGGLSLGLLLVAGTIFSRMKKRSHGSSPDKRGGD